ncbi:hypothetical protein [Actinokineospora alba]|uniref:hypothetical protein n=1 Tax=Actinokineospora alba TaxID=504798 RepID=UPI001E37A180|nr:hypothetical protein [Actinokineospora alba]
MTGLTTTAPTAAADVAPTYRRWRFRIFAITWIAYAGFYFTRQTMSVAKVGILQDPTVNLTLTKAVLGNLDALYLIAYALGQFVWGTLADRFGPQGDRPRRARDVRRRSRPVGHRARPHPVRPAHDRPRAGAVHRLVPAVQERRPVLHHR